MRSAILFAAVFSSLALCAGDDAADLTFRFNSASLVRYSWTMTNANVTEGRDQGRPFKFTNDTTFATTMELKGLLLKRDGIPLAVKYYDASYTEKKAIDQSSIEVQASAKKMKVTENGKVIVDSENDIGLDKVNDMRERFKSIEATEVRMVLDNTGKPIDAQGDVAIVNALKGNGAQGLFPILAGKTVKVGESWEESFEMPQLGEFKLAQPAVIKSKMTFVRWEEKNGEKLARIEVATAWANDELKGENGAGLLVEITKKEGGGAGWCHFDPKTGLFVDGELAMVMKYHLQGERGGEAVGLDITGNTRYVFSRK